MSSIFADMLLTHTFANNVKGDKVLRPSQNRSSLISCRGPASQRWLPRSPKYRALEWKPSASIESQTSVADHMNDNNNMVNCVNQNTVLPELLDSDDDDLGDDWIAEDEADEVHNVLMGEWILLSIT